MTKLFRATLEIEFFVEAENDDEAYEVARNSASEAMSDTWHPEIFLSEVSDLKSVPKDWRPSFPYGAGEPERTCQQILESAVSEGEK